MCRHHWIGEHFKGIHCGKCKKTKPRLTRWDWFLRRLGWVRITLPPLVMSFDDLNCPYLWR